MTRQSGRAFSARTFVIGPVPAPSSTRTFACCQSTFRTVARESHRLLGARLAIAVPCRKNFPRNKKKSRISHWCVAKGDVGGRRTLVGDAEAGATLALS